jgi:FKBP-type peptidyl-prolyl cis-trans isomerase FkpA
MLLAPLLCRSGRFMRIVFSAAALALVLASFARAQSALQDGERFLKENATKPGVSTTASGLQFKVLKEGTGKSPKATDVVVVNYRGTLINGKEFDSSYKSGKPIEFPLNRVIPGWTEGVQLMKEGAKYEFFIPPSLAYGSRGAGGVIGPNETLIFEVELLKVK